MTNKSNFFQLRNYTDFYFIYVFIYLFILLNNYIFANILKYQIFINSLYLRHQIVIKTLFSLLQLGKLKSNLGNDVELGHVYT